MNSTSISNCLEKWSKHDSGASFFAAVVRETPQGNDITILLRRLGTVQLDQLVRWAIAGLSQQEIVERLNVSHGVISHARNR